MNNSGDAAEQIVRLSLEGFEVAAKVTGEAAKNIAILLISALKQEQKTKGKARLTTMIKSGQELKVFAIQKKDLKEFTKHAKKYGVLYTVLRDKKDKGGNGLVDIIARATDASKIQRIMDRFDLTAVDTKTIIKESEKAVNNRTKQEKDKDSNSVDNSDATQPEKDDFFDDIFADEAETKEAVEKEKPEKSRADVAFKEEVSGTTNKEKASENPSIAKTEKSPLSEQNSKGAVTLSDEGTAAKKRKPSVKKKLNKYKADLKDKKQKGLDKTAPFKSGKTRDKNNSSPGKPQEPIKKTKRILKER